MRHVVCTLSQPVELLMVSHVTRGLPELLGGDMNTSSLANVTNFFICLSLIAMDPIGSSAPSRAHLISCETMVIVKTRQQLRASRTCVCYHTTHYELSAYVTFLQCSAQSSAI